MQTFENRRILIVDDNAAIHGDFRKILGAAGASTASAALTASEDALFGDDEPAPAAAPTSNAVLEAPSYDLSFALQGQEAFAAVRTAREEGLPFAVAFVDMRMPPGWDGVETILHLWEVEPDLQVVVCTAFSDHSWQDMVAKLGRTDRLLILKKPFDAVEVAQLASALTQKWNTLMGERAHLEDARRAEMQARAYASSLETVNHALEASWAKADAELRRSRAMLLQAADELLSPALAQILSSLALGDATGDGAAFERASEQTRDMARALETFIELARVNGEASPGPLEPIDPDQILASVASSVPPSDRARVNVRPSAGAAKLTSHPQRLQRLLSELVDNSLRWTQGAEVVLRVETSDGGPRSEDVVQFIVEDSGRGLPRDAQKRLFEPFGRAEVEGASHGGPGLGLALCKRIADTLGGSLNYETSSQGGARFRLKLPTG